MTGALAAVLLAAAVASSPAERFELQPDDRVVLVGNTFAERLALSGYFEALVHAAHPGTSITVRSVPWSADEVGLRPREHQVPTLEDHLAALEPDVIVMCFGMTESFAGEAGIEAFEDALAEQLDALAPARRILVSPIAHEDLGAPMVTGADLVRRNEVLSRYVETMRRVATAKGVRFVDLFPVESGFPLLTSNGIHPDERGCQRYAREIGLQLGWVPPEDGRRPPGAGDPGLRRLAYDKHYHERLLYRPTNTEYVWGRRHEPYGIVNFPPEMAQLERMVTARQHALWSMVPPRPGSFLSTPPTGPAVWEEVPTSNDYPQDEWHPAPVEAKGTETSLGELDIPDPEAFLASFTVPDGYAISCFASEREIPELRNPLAMAFDAAGRLWVLCTPTYPHLLPGEAPRCMLIVLEDGDGDGRADTRTIFADRLYIPTGFAIDVDAVYVGQAPDLWKLTDTDGDGRADRREIVASGFGMPDSHHTISAFEWDPGGGILMHEGVFTKSNVETPYGIRRSDGAAVWRFDPRTQRLEILAHCYFNNPWGHAFDDFGQSVLADASGGENFAFSQVVTAFDYPRKPKRVGAFLNRGRPTAGCELIDSRHFPDDVQGSFLVNQSIGFHGTRWDRIIPDGSAWRAEPMPQDLVKSTDANFRPVAMEIGPDGALYIADWCNPIIGHMQYSVRDPRRDHDHGRIWQVRHVDRPLATPPVIADAIPELLRQLVSLERNPRRHARRRLQTAPPAEVFPELTSFVSRLDPDDPDTGRLLLEALWIHQGQGRIELDLLDRVATHADPRVRAGAVRVLRHWLQERHVPAEDALPRLERAVGDADMRVRLEGVQACGFIPGVDGAAVAAVAGEREMDDGLRLALQETLVHLEQYGEPDVEIVRRLRLERTPVPELLGAPLDDLGARVRLLRADVPLPRRVEALTYLAGLDDEAVVTRLVDEVMGSPRPERAVRAAAPLLLGLSGAQLAAGRSALDRAAASRSAAVRTLVAACRFRMGVDGSDLVDGDPDRLVAVMSYLDAADAEAVAPIRRAVQRAVSAGLVEPRPAVEQVARHMADEAARVQWLVGLIDAVADRGLDRFDRRHEAAMAALRILNSVPDAAGSVDDRFRIHPIADEAIAAGRVIYRDEIRGCARCHGIDGRGNEGFPPLDRSPLVLGNPERAAAIVAHGLHGRLRLYDGRVFDSAMAPLGGLLDDEEIATVLSYVRQSWGNYAEQVTVENVRAARAAKVDGQPISVREVAVRYPVARDRIAPGLSGTGYGTRSAAAGPRWPLFVALVVSGLVIAIAVAGRLWLGRTGGDHGAT